jgi:hypothetical protein
METKETKVPDGTVFTLCIPLDRKGEKTATFYLKDMTEELFMAVSSMAEAKKDFDAVRLTIKELSLPGSDSVDTLKGNFYATQLAANNLQELIRPKGGELKKN